ncbi:MAG: ABC transporter ATP-binding protein [Actinomycetota bacterium]|nr:ABC transporter ATP-binding protein [Actinomycetota bacterium]
MTASSIQFDAVDLVFAGSSGTSTSALAGVQLTVDPGQFLAVVGPSGCGKTTLLRLAAGLLSPTSGTVRRDGKIVDGPSAGIGFVFQQPALLPWRTVLDNVLLPAQLDRRPSMELRERAAGLLELLGLRDFLGARPRELSGGMQQRVAVARALLLQPSLLLLDEPFGALDAISREELQSELARAWETSGATAILVTHDLGEAAFLADRVVVLTSRPGTVHSDVPVPRSGIRTPEHRFSAGYVQLCRELRSGLEHATAGAGR